MARYQGLQLCMLLGLLVLVHHAHARRSLQGRQLRTAATVESEQKPYDFFYFVRQWPGNYCSQHSCPLLKDRGFHFTIHGLWPNYKDGGWPQFCDNDYKFDEDDIDDIEDAMEEEWPSFMGEDDTFWEHEWTKHGTCSLDVLPSEHKYFKTVLKLHWRYDLAAALRAAGIRPCNKRTYSSDEISRAIDDMYGVRPLVHCFDNKLSEIWMCFDKNLRPFDCKPEAHSSNACGDDVTIPRVSEMPTSAHDTAASGREGMGEGDTKEPAGMLTSLLRWFGLDGNEDEQREAREHDAGSQGADRSHGHDTDDDDDDDDDENDGDEHEVEDRLKRQDGDDDDDEDDDDNDEDAQDDDDMVGDAARGNMDATTDTTGNMYTYDSYLDTYNDKDLGYLYYGDGSEYYDDEAAYYDDGLLDKLEEELDRLSLYDIYNEDGEYGGNADADEEDEDAEGGAAREAARAQQGKQQAEAAAADATDTEEDRQGEAEAEDENEDAGMGMAALAADAGGVRGHMHAGRARAAGGHARMRGDRVRAQRATVDHSAVVVTDAEIQQEMLDVMHDVVSQRQDQQQRTSPFSRPLPAPANIAAMAVAALMALACAAMLVVISVRVASAVALRRAAAAAAAAGGQAPQQPAKEGYEPVLVVPDSPSDSRAGA